LPVRLSVTFNDASGMAFSVGAGLMWKPTSLSVDAAPAGVSDG
jgi:hypothetical protein